MLTESDICGKFEELGGFIPDEIEAGFPGGIFPASSNCKALGKLKLWRSTGLGIRTCRSQFQRGYSLALGPATSPLSPSGSLSKPASEARFAYHAALCHLPPTPCCLPLP